MIKPKVYIFEGGAPDKVFTFDESFDVSLVDTFESPSNSFELVMNQCNEDGNYMLVCSENQLVKLAEYDKNDIPENIIYLRSTHPDWNYLTKLNVLELPEKYTLHQTSYTLHDSFPMDFCGKEWILKRVGNSGGRGLIPNTTDSLYLRQWGFHPFLTSESEILEFLNLTMDVNHPYILQELVPSRFDDYAVSVLVRHGKLRDYTIIKSKGNKFSPKWYNFTVDHNKDTVDYLMPLIEDTIKSLGITDGFFEIECTGRDYDTNPKVIEINPRYSWTTSMSRYMESGYSPIECYLNDSYIPFYKMVGDTSYDMKVTEFVIKSDEVDFYKG